MPTSAALEEIWVQFKVARTAKDKEAMKLALSNFDDEYDPEKLPRYAPQKQMARRGVMKRAIEKFCKIPTYSEYEDGW